MYSIPANYNEKQSLRSPSSNRFYAPTEKLGPSMAPSSNTVYRTLTPTILSNESRQSLVRGATPVGMGGHHTRESSQARQLGNMSRPTEYAYNNAGYRVF